MASVSLGNKYLAVGGRSNTVCILKDGAWKKIGTLLAVQYYLITRLIG